MKILKFFGDWCSPCRTLTTMLDGHDFPIEGVNIDLFPERAREYGVRTLPTLVFIDEDGKELKKKVGLTSSEEVKKILNDLRANINA